MRGALQWEGTFAARGLESTLVVPRGAVLALVGPNGAGKSTTLDLLAGLLTPDAGRLSIGDNVLLDTASGVDVPAHRRRIAVLGQDPLLFPHLRVAANVEFGPRSQGASRGQARRRAADLLEQVDAARFATRYPAQLSGGQSARVALARALATTPRAVLLDEPFAALDVAVAPQMRRVLATEVRRHGAPVVLVTHDLLDVLALADEVAVIEDGRIVETGPTERVLRAPTSAFAAGLAGVNHVRGRLTAPGTLIADGPSGLVVRGSGAATDPTATAVAVWPPSAVALYREPPQGSPRNVWTGTVAELVDRGGVVRVHVDVGADRVLADLSPAAVRDLDLRPGLRVTAVVKAQEVSLHPASPGS